LPETAPNGLGPQCSNFPGFEKTNYYALKEIAKLDLTTTDQQAGWHALERLLLVAQQDTGQARRVANFLLAWHNAEENGGWDPIDLWNVDAAIADDMLTVMRLIRESHRYPDDLGFRDEIAAVWRLWRGAKAATGPESQPL
jgi:hypothetical protein